MTLTDKTRALRLEWKRLQDQHEGLEAWTLRYDRARRRYGSCQYEPRTVTLSRVLVELNDLEESLDTLRHEAAHVLAGPYAGHGPAWRAACVMTGATPERCYKPDDVQTPKAPWHLVCRHCGTVVARRHRRDRRMEKKACASCCNQHNQGRWHKDFRLRFVPAPSDAG